MEICSIDSARRYHTFIRQIYQSNPYFRDTMFSVIQGIMTGRAAICRSSQIRPIQVIDDNRPVAQAILTSVNRLPDTVQITFFDAMENCGEAVDLIIQSAQEMAHDVHADKIIVGLNFHVNYGLGILTDHFDTVQGFGLGYNPPWYPDYFRDRFHQQYHLSSYLTDIHNFDYGVDTRVKERLIHRFTVRRANFQRFDDEIRIYTHLNNKAFSNHRFYYTRNIEEDLELFHSLKILLREENLLIVEDGGIPIGFMLWYPDFNELIPAHGAIGLSTVIRNRLCPRSIKKMKIVELGILPEYKNTGAVMALFHHLQIIASGRFSECETGWILEENLASRGLAKRWSDQEYRHFSVYEMAL